ncbi:MAG: 4Fe-4S binding protein [Clostridiales bacterium]|nr:4Fe-4S binding protein [Clostridiales bacterium]
MAKKKRNKKLKKRHLIQAVGALALNGQLSGFVTGNIYTGAGKQICLPVLNCYSCPGALTSCPIGSLQAVANHPGFSFSYYIMGLIALFGIVAGRFYCGWLCPFGFLQDLLAKINKEKLQVKAKYDRPLRYLKYIILVFLVLLLPAVLTNSYGIGSPLFCKYICPSGTLGAGLPLLLLTPALRPNVGVLLAWKVLLALAVIMVCLYITRAFCRYVCPLGALLGLLQMAGFYRFSYDKASCISCQQCAKICPLGIDPMATQNGPECLRCRDCLQVCPTAALTSSLAGKALPAEILSARRKPGQSDPV